MKASRDLADAPQRQAATLGERAAQRMLAFHHVQADGLVLTATSRPMVSPDATASAAMSGCASWIRKEDWSKPQASCTLSGPGPYSPSCSATKPQREQRHLPVQRALRQAGLFGQRRDAERPVMPGQRGQHIQDAIRAGADRGVGCQDSSPNELERRLSIYGFDPANYSRKLRITRENPSKYEKNINKAVASQAKAPAGADARRAPACAPGKAGIRLRPGARWTPGCAPRNAPSTAGADLP